MENKKIFITGLKRTEKKWNDGEKLLAIFDCDIGGILIQDCSLVRASRGFLLAQPPKYISQNGKRRIVQIVDRDLRVEIAEAAHAVYQEFGGQG